MRLTFDKKRLRYVLLLLSFPLGIIAIFGALDLRINLTPSHVPVGIWRAFPPDSVGVGDVVRYDIEELYSRLPHVREERMNFHSSGILKKVAALSGAVISLSGDIVVIDGHEYHNAPIAGDDSWRKVDYPLVVPEGSVWLMADVRSAYDSRYHGPLPADIIREKCEPVIVW
jgi:type IV secretory pathway protease TraF